MKITALTGNRLHLGSIGSNGVTLPAATESPNYIVVDDEYADNSVILRLRDQGYFSISEFSKEEASSISAIELNEHVLGLYVCAYPTNSPGNILGGTSADVISTEDELFDLRARNYFRFLVDDVLATPIYDIEVSVSKGLHTAASLVGALNGITAFSTHLVASVETSTKVKVTCRSKGASSFIVAATPTLAPLANANDALGFPIVAPTTAGTGTASRLQATFKGPTSVGLHRAKIAAAAYTTDSGGGDVVTAGAFIQVPRKGTILSNLYTAGSEAIVEADLNGEIDIEFADTAHADNPVFLGLIKPSGYDFAVVPNGGGTRVSVTNA